VVSLQCSHQLHSSCARDVITQGQGGAACIQCPQCQTVHGTRIGTQPLDSYMTWATSTASLPGYQGVGTIAIRYGVQPGLQGPEHPHPGKPYHALGFPRMAFLPDNVQGRRILLLLKVAFQRRLVFTVGPSLTRGMEDCVTWAGIHHKTLVQDLTGGGHGFPDAGYLDRVEDELRERGVTYEEEKVEEKVKEKSADKRKVKKAKNKCAQEIYTTCHLNKGINVKNISSYGRGREGDSRILV